MKRQQWGPYAVALAILIVGLVWVGVPAYTLLFAGLILICPLMMFFMMRGMHDGESSHTTDYEQVHRNHDLHDAGRK